MAANIFGEDHVHMMASDSGAGALIHAGNHAGFKVRDKIIIICPIPLFLGPISHLLTPQRHFEWLENHVPDALESVSSRVDDVSREKHAMEDSLSLMKAINSPKTYWYSSRNIAEYSSFLTFVCTQQPDENFNFVDVAQAELTGTGECTPEAIYEAYKGAFKLDAPMMRKFQVQFDAMNGPDVQVLHLFGQGEFKNAPYDYLDEAILTHIGKDWRSLSQSFAYFYIEQCENKHRREFTYEFLLWRLSVLRASGKIERRGQSVKPHNPLQGEVRRGG